MSFTTEEILYDFLTSTKTLALPDGLTVLPLRTKGNQKERDRRCRKLHPERYYQRDKTHRLTHKNHINEKRRRRYRTETTHRETLKRKARERWHRRKLRTAQ